jgi:hypothetical protein
MALTIEQKERLITKYLYIYIFIYHYISIYIYLYGVGAVIACDTYREASSSAIIFAFLITGKCLLKHWTVEVERAISKTVRINRQINLKKESSNRDERRYTAGTNPPMAALFQSSLACSKPKKSSSASTVDCESTRKAQTFGGLS